MICSSCHGENDDAAEVCFHCRHVLVPITRGAVLAGRYEILSVLGRGGMGMVYKAHDRVLDETVAVKLLRAEYARDAEVAARFRAEIKLARKVSHRNVCRIHEYGEDQGFGFIGMEYVDGGDLKSLIQHDGGLSPSEAFDVAIQVADGLEAIHDVRIVHRDLKTVNIMRSAQGVVKVMDFGIAKQSGPEGTTGATATGQILGTPEYMSPEQARGQKADFRSDVYALGVVTFEIFTGRVPFRGDSPVATLLMHSQDPPPLDEPIARRIPAPLVPVLRKALAKDPRHRYAAAAEMAKEMRAARDAWTGGGGVEGVTLPRPTAAARTPGGSWLGPAMAAAAVAALAAAAPVPAVVVPPPPTSAPPEPTAARSPTPPAARKRLSPAAADGPPEPAPLSTAVPDLLPPATPALVDVTKPAATATAAPEEIGVLQIVAVPFADVMIDDREMGRVSSAKFPVSPGPHLVVLSHPDYQPVRRKVTVIGGATEKLVLDLAEEAIRRKK